MQIQVVDPELITEASTMVITTDLLGKTYHADMKFENPDASPYRFERDFFGKRRPDADVTPGPFELRENDKADFEF